MAESRIEVTNRAAVVALRRVGLGESRVDHDLVAIEAPLSIEIVREDRGDVIPLGLMMRTPGDDRDLVLGFLHAEGIICAAADILDIVDGENRVSVTLARHVDVAGVANRAQPGTSACGLCGRLAMNQLDRGSVASPGIPRVHASVIASIPGRLQPHQAVFAETGGLHAAGLFDAHGTLELLREDVGRHNAVDKTIGAALAASRLPLHASLLAVSGRVAYEIVQKAAMAGIPIVVAVGAPSDLAVEAARTAGLTLAGFVRDERFNVYTHPERIRE